MSADRNLLFGILALHADLIDRDQFIRACSDWATRKQTPLADVLIDLGFLTQEDRVEVERLLERKLKKHGGDVQASLAEVADDAVRESLAQVHDGEVLQTVTPPPPTVAVSTTAWTSDHHGRYWLVRLHATGGIGQVWVARDSSLGREVAFKELRPDRDAAAQTERFLKEAQITGQLEHPGIVPIYELGSKREGDGPFYTMRFVRGRTMKDTIAAYHERRKRGEAGPLELRELLNAFVAVCNAVAYAHSRGVLHRDLKPQNVVMGDFGEVMVLDWGLAKLLSEPEALATVPPHAVANAAGSDRPIVLDDSSDATQPGQVLGTPAYMAPEQADGRLDLMDARTDVYGLGAIFYHLLTGSPPFDGTNTPEVLDKVRHDPPVRPRERVAATPPALEAICLKALAKDRAGRFASAKDFASDVQHWLADEPVNAYRDPLPARLRRWGRKHRAVVTAAAALVLTATAALTIGLIAVNAEKNRTAQALEAESAALERSQRAEKSASEQRQLALKTVRGVVTDIHERLKDRPGHKELRKELLARALAGLKEVARAADTADADHETIWALFELGDLFLYIEEGGTPEAKAQYQKAHEIAMRLAEADKTSTQAQRDLYVSYKHLGDVEIQLGDTKAALASYQKGLDVRLGLADADMSTVQPQRDLSVSYINLGNVQLRMGDTKAALASYQKGLEVNQRLADADKTNTESQRLLSVSYINLGDVQAEMGDPKAALANYQKALEVRQRLADADKTSIQAQSYLSFSYDKLCDVQLRMGDTTSALASHQKSLEVRQRVADADKTSVEAQRDLSTSYSRLGDVQMQMRDIKAALASYQKGLEMRQRLADTDKTNTHVQRDLGVSYDRLGNVQMEMGDTKAALASYQKGLKVSLQLAEADKSNAQAQRDLLISFFKLGQLEEQSGEFSKAAVWYSKSLEIPRNFSKPEFFMKEIKALEDRVRFCRAAEQALADPVSALNQSEALRLPVLNAVTNALAKQKKPDKALATAELLAQNASNEGHLYDAACAYAICAPLADKPETKEKRAQRAVELLRQAVAKGYKDAAHMKTDSDLDALREREDFKKLLAELETNSKTKQQ